MSSLYNFALEEYDNEEIGAKHKIIYAYFGLAIYRWQCIEKEFENMLWIKNAFIKDIKSLKEFDSMVNEIEWKRYTMWKQMRELRKIYNFSQELELELVELLEIRNYLIHKYFKENIQKFSSRLWVQEMLKYFINFIEKAGNLDQKLQIYTDDYKKKLWITDEKINILMEELQNKEKLRDL